MQAEAWLLFEASHVESEVNVSKIALNPSAIAMFPFCAFGISVMAGGEG